jgi:hypothetical protein
MSRTKYTFTFTLASPGDVVRYNVPTYPSMDYQSTGWNEGSNTLDESKSVSVWADAPRVIATTLADPGYSLLATTDDPTVTDP